MITYKDMTFCDFKDCQNKDCNRRLTEQIKRDAKAFGLPICRYAIKPECYINKQEAV